MLGFPGHSVRTLLILSEAKRAGKPAPLPSEASISGCGECAAAHVSASSSSLLWVAAGGLLFGGCGAFLLLSTCWVSVLSHHLLFKPLDVVLVFMPHAEEERTRFSDFLKTSVRTLSINDLVKFSVFKA